MNFESTKLPSLKNNVNSKYILGCIILPKVIGFFEFPLSPTRGKARFARPPLDRAAKNLGRSQKKFGAPAGAPNQFSK